MPEWLRLENEYFPQGLRFCTVHTEPDTSQIRNPNPKPEFGLHQSESPVLGKNTWDCNPLLMRSCRCNKTRADCMGLYPHPTDPTGRSYTSLAQTLQLDFRGPRRGWAGTGREWMRRNEIRGQRWKSLTLTNHNIRNGLTSIAVPVAQNTRRKGCQYADGIDWVEWMFLLSHAPRWSPPGHCSSPRDSDE